MPVNQDLLEFLVCPETNPPVALADDGILSTLTA